MKTFYFDVAIEGESWIEVFGPILSILPFSNVFIHSFQIFFAPECTRKVRTWKQKNIITVQPTSGSWLVRHMLPRNLDQSISLCHWQPTLKCLVHKFLFIHTPFYQPKPPD